jgi:hypothetical protein
MCVVANGVGQADFLPIRFALGRRVQIEVMGQEAALAASLDKSKAKSDCDPATKYVEQQIHAQNLCVQGHKNKGVAPC